MNVPSEESAAPELYDVVLNDEEQYSIWPSGRELPAGWRTAGFRGSREECLEHVDKVWVDMRPLSLRKWMEEQERIER
jgi:MbtH protein